jgi:hypothetical protein
MHVSSPLLSWHRPCSPGLLIAGGYNTLHPLPLLLQSCSPATVSNRQWLRTSDEMSTSSEGPSCSPPSPPSMYSIMGCHTHMSHDLSGSGKSQITMKQYVTLFILVVCSNLYNIYMYIYIYTYISITTSLGRPGTD